MTHESCPEELRFGQDREEGVLGVERRGGISKE